MAAVLFVLSAVYMTIGKVLYPPRHLVGPFYSGQKFQTAWEELKNTHQIQVKQMPPGSDSRRASDVHRYIVCENFDLESSRGTLELIFHKDELYMVSFTPDDFERLLRLLTTRQPEIAHASASSLESGVVIRDGVKFRYSYYKKHYFTWLDEMRFDATLLLY